MGPMVGAVGLRKKKTWTYMSNEKRAPGCLVYIGGYTTQLYRDYNKPL